MFFGSSAKAGSEPVLTAATFCEAVAHSGEGFVICSQILTVSTA